MKSGSGELKKNRKQWKKKKKLKTPIDKFFSTRKELHSEMKL